MTKRLSEEEKRSRAVALSERRAASAVETAARRAKKLASKEKREQAAQRTAAWRAKMDETPEGRETRLSRLRAATGAHYTRNRELYLDSHYRRRYGLSLEQVKALIVEQSYTCAICEDYLPLTTAYEKGLALDHNHDTGKVRGVLCRGCNLGLGNFRENPAALEQAAAYVRRHQQG